MIPEQPNDESIKPVLASLPAPPKYSVLRSGVDRNGRMYTLEVIARAVHQTEGMVNRRALFVHMRREPLTENPPTLRNIVGFVDWVEDGGGEMLIEVKLIDKHTELLLPVARFSVDATATVDGGRVCDDYCVHSISMSCEPSARRDK